MNEPDPPAPPGAPPDGPAPDAEPPEAGAPDAPLVDAPAPPTAEPPPPTDRFAPTPRAPAARPRSEGARLRTLYVGAALACVVLGLSVVSIVRDTAKHVDGPPAAPQPPLATSPVVTPTAPPLATPAAPTSPPAAAALPSAAPERGDVTADEFLEGTDDGEPAPKPAPPKRYATVQQAAAESCTTKSVEGLSRQIIEQARCIKPNAFVPLPSRPNLSFANNVFPYLELNAKQHLLKALDANPGKRMTVNSALRTVAQQYLVSRWAAGRRCGVPLATPPGDSNHEVGTAIDIAEPGQWRTALEKQNFRWLGASDRVHFDFGGDSAPRKTATDVLAFQTLWNRNHPDDPIAASGRYDSATEQRLKKAPPEGFPKGPSCKK